MKNEKLQYSPPALNMFLFEVYSVMQETGSTPGGGEVDFVPDDTEYF